MSKIKLKRGDDESWQVEIVEAQADGSLQPVDLSHLQRADLHAKANGNVVLQLSTENGLIEKLDPQRGVFLLHFLHNLTEDADWLIADYDLQLIDGEGRRKTVLSGRIELSPDVTRVGL